MASDEEQDMGVQEFAEETALSVPEWIRVQALAVYNSDNGMCLLRHWAKVDFSIALARAFRLVLLRD